MEHFDLFGYMNDNSPDNFFLPILLGFGVATILFIAKPLLKYLLVQEPVTNANQVNNLDENGIDKLLEESRLVTPVRADIGSETRSETNGEAIAADEVMLAATTLSKFRCLLKPSMPLTSSIFPRGMRVLRFEPEKILKLQIISTAGEKGCLASFSILQWTIFPAMLGGGLFSLMLGSSNSWIGVTAGTAIGLYFWAKLQRTGPYLNIDLQKKTYSNISVAGGTWYSTPPNVEIQSTFSNNVWSSAVLVGGQIVVTRTTTQGRVEAEKDLKPFVAALNWSLGNRVSVVNGVLIEPPKGPAPAPPDREPQNSHQMLRGPQIRQLLDAITSCFAKADLEQLMRIELNEKLNLLVSENLPFNETVFKVIEWSENNGKTKQLVQALQKERPNSDAIKSITRELFPPSAPASQVQQ